MITLYPFQEDILRKTAGENHVAYFLDMGLGKTFVGSEKLYQLHSKINLVVCQKSKLEDWINHFLENYHFLIFNLTTKAGYADFFHCLKYNERDVIVGIINYELLWRRKDFLGLSDFTLMLDESSLIQNRKAKQSKFILKLNYKNVILLSGTPCSGKYENLWTQAHLLGWGIDEDLYLRQYVNWKLIRVGKAFHKIVDMNNPYKNVNRLKNKFREHGAVFMKTDEVIDLPEQNYIPVKCKTSKDYRQFKKDRIITVNGVELIGDTTLTLMLRMRQLCGQYSENKLEAFKDLMDSTNDRLIVFYNFNEELEELRKLCNKPVSIVNGSTKDLKAYEKHSDSVTFIQYQAGSMGLNLQLANKVIYFTLPLRSELFEQSKKRIHRIGQKNTCMYYIMLCEGSIEEKIYNTLKLRKDYTDDLFKEEFKC